MIDTRIRTALLAGLIGLLSGCTRPTPPPPPPANSDRITQISVINSLMIGRYDGIMPISDVLQLGDFGVGTLDHLDGELILLDGKAYQVRGDGEVLEVGPGRSTPFVVVTPFNQDGEFPAPKVGSLENLDSQLDQLLPQKNNFVAVRIDGHFHTLTLRSVPRQEPPYQPLAEVAKSQKTWTHADLKGTLVGIRSPAWVKGMNVPGYHWHFLSEDKKVGGHVLDCRVVEATVRYDVCRDWLIKLDGSAQFNEANLGQDLGRELRQVESSRGGQDAPKP